MRIKLFTGISVVVLLVIPLAVVNYFQRHKPVDRANVIDAPATLIANWKAPDTSEISHSPQPDLIRYGRELILHTSAYLGRHGSVAQISNGMNCQNCHVDGGTRPFANNFSSVASIYPVFKKRSGKLETVAMRINDCFERSLNGQPIPDSGKEMKAIIAYIYWIGHDVPKGIKTKNSGTENLSFLNRPANIANGRKIYYSMCQNCHGANGEGKLADDGKEYTYPPLWGRHSYNVSAGIYQLSKFAGFVKNNMPLGATKHLPEVSSDEAWDVAAFVNSRPRPTKYFKADWPDISSKPADYPFGPYSDGFSTTQHKYGPFEIIQNAHKKPSLKN
ncbi:MAG: c-type cytochrome [Ginsengibacter sp.]|jgi:thiosulfate dehydrogenase